MLDQTLKRLRREHSKAIIHAHAVARLSAEMSRLKPTEIQPEIAYEVINMYMTNVQALAHANREILARQSLMESLQAQASSAAHSAGDLAESMSDTVMMTEQISDMLKIAYMQLARHILGLMPDLIGYAVKEVVSHAGGKEQLELLRAAIDEVLSPVEGG
jgi:hypothetical protein